MKPQPRWLPILIVGLIQLGCATTAPYNPFKIAQDEFYAKTKTIALAPIAIPGDLENPLRACQSQI